MAEPRASIIDGKKFMWDGRLYDDREEAETARQGYEKEGFETRMVTEDDSLRVYTRRVVSHIELTGPPPA